MSSIYGYLLGIVGLALLLNILIVTQSRQPKGEVGVAPVVQLVLTVPLLLVSAGVYFFTQDLTPQAGLWSLCLPLLLEAGLFAATGDLLDLFKPGAEGFLVRSYVGAIATSTALGLVLAWVLGALNAA